MTAAPWRDCVVHRPSQARVQSHKDGLRLRVAGREIPLAQSDAEALLGAAQGRLRDDLQIGGYAVVYDTDYCDSVALVGDGWAATIGMDSPLWNDLRAALQGALRWRT